MNWYLKKLISFILTILSVAVLSFIMFQIIPGNAAISRLGTEATPEAIEALKIQYGYDKPLPERFITWLGGAVRGDFGPSMRYETLTVSELIKGRLPVTLTLAGMSVLLIIVIAIPIGLLTTRDPDGPAGRQYDGERRDDPGRHREQHRSRARPGDRRGQEPGTQRGGPDRAGNPGSVQRECPQGGRDRIL